MIQDSREQFEAAYDEYTGQPAGTAYSLRMVNSYRTPKLSSAWNWWQASREAVVVTGLSFDEEGVKHLDPVDMAMKHAIRRIEAAGVKVAP